MIRRGMIFALLAAVELAHAQEYRGRVQGVVSDSSRAVVAGANELTNWRWSSASFWDLLASANLAFRD